MAKTPKAETILVVPWNHTVEHALDSGLEKPMRKIFYKIFSGKREKDEVHGTFVSSPEVKIGKPALQKQKLYSWETWNLPGL